MHLKSEEYSRLVRKITDLTDRYQPIGTEYYSALHDYGTGVLYTSTEVHMVTRIEENPGITASKIAEDTNRTKSAVSQMISKLEAKGLIYREKDPGNGKQFFLYVTPKGNHLSLCHKAYDETATPIKEIVERFGPEAVQNYIDIVEYMIAEYTKRKKK